MDQGFMRKPPSSYQNRQNELFVGNLSYFCSEAHLYDLFSPFGIIQTLRIKQNDKGTRPLQFGFVLFSTLSEAEDARRTMDGAMIMGRTMKVEFSQGEKPKRPASNHEGVELHIHFHGEFPPDAIVQPTEEFLRQVYERFGPILDVTVKEYHEKPYKQDGYGFITFETKEGAMNAADSIPAVVIEGIKLTCNLSRHFNNAQQPQPYYLGNGVGPSQSSPHYGNSFGPGYNKHSAPYPQGARQPFPGQQFQQFPNHRNQYMGGVGGGMNGPNMHQQQFQNHSQYFGQQPGRSHQQHHYQQHNYQPQFGGPQGNQNFPRSRFPGQIPSHMPTYDSQPSNFLSSSNTQQGLPSSVFGFHTPSSVQSPYQHQQSLSLSSRSNYDDPNTSLSDSMNTLSMSSTTSQVSRNNYNDYSSRFPIPPNPTDTQFRGSYNTNNASMYVQNNNYINNNNKQHLPFHNNNNNQSSDLFPFGQNHWSQAQHAQNYEQNAARFVTEQSQTQASLPLSQTFKSESFEYPNLSMNARPRPLLPSTNLDDPFMYATTSSTVTSSNIHEHNHEHDVVNHILNSDIDEDHWGKSLLMNHQHQHHSSDTSPLPWDDMTNQTNSNNSSDKTNSTTTLTAITSTFSSSDN